MKNQMTAETQAESVQVRRHGHFGYMFLNEGKVAA